MKFFAMMTMSDDEPAKQRKSEDEKMFDTNTVAKNIKEGRISKNMTQMDLADAMGVSYQAVSNWERGNSMPDISKIPDLCKILDLNLEEMLGGESKATRVAHRIVEDENAKVTMEELVDVVPILKPEQVDKVIDENMGSDSGEEKIDIKMLIGLAPFLSEEKLDAMVDQIGTNDLGALVGLAPFLSKKTLRRCVEKSMADENTDANSVKIIGLAPFLDKETLEKYVEWYLSRENKKMGSLVGLAPFLSRGTLQKIVTYIQKCGNLKDLIAFGPFIGKWMDIDFSAGKRDAGQTDRSAEEECADRDSDTDISKLDEEDVSVLANQEYDAGRSVERFLQYMDEEDVSRLAGKFVRDGRSAEHLLQYMDEDEVGDLANLALEKGMNIEPYLEYMDEDEMRGMIKKMAGSRKES